MCKEVTGCYRPGVLVIWLCILLLSGAVLIFNSTLFFMGGGCKTVSCLASSPFGLQTLSFPSIRAVAYRLSMPINRVEPFRWLQNNFISVGPSVDR
jgi:hypothetical protein